MAGLSSYLAVALGGALGSIARHWAGTLAGRLGTRLPVGTFFINVIACGVIGFTLTLLKLHTGIDPIWRPLVVVGFIGAFSTFSTFEWEIYSGFEVGAALMTALYLTGSIVIGLLAVWLGATVAAIHWY